MNKKIFALATAMLLAFTATFASTTKPVPDAVIKEVNQHFGNAAVVTWRTTSSYYKASINMHGKYLEVFYNLNGSLIGVSRNIAVDQLPLVLLKDVQAHKASHYVADLFELVTEEGGTEYFITYKNGTETKSYRGATDGWNLYQASAQN